MELHVGMMCKTETKKTWTLKEKKMKKKHGGRTPDGFLAMMVWPGLTF